MPGVMLPRCRADGHQKTNRQDFARQKMLESKSPLTCTTVNQNVPRHSFQMPGILMIRPKLDDLVSAFE